MYRLVVIDDEYIVVQGIKALISRLKLDYEVVGAAYDGIQGLEVIRSEKPDVVITDIRIPGLDGLSVIEAAKEECPDTYFIVISGYSEFVYAQRALTLGVKDYIDKPVTAEKLKNALARVPFCGGCLFGRSGCRIIRTPGRTALPRCPQNTDRRPCLR